MRKFAIESLISLDAALDSRDDSKAISRYSYCVFQTFPKILRLLSKTGIMLLKILLEDRL